MSLCNKNSTKNLADSKSLTCSEIYLSVKVQFLDALTVFVKLCLPFIIYQAYNLYFHTVPQLLMVMFCSQMFIVLPAFNYLYWTVSCFISAMAEFFFFFFLERLSSCSYSCSRTWFVKYRPHWLC